MTDNWFKDLSSSQGFINYANRRPGNYNVPEAVEFFNEKMDFKDTDYIADVGCGNGMTAHELYRYSHRIVAIDIVPNMVELAKKFLKNDTGILMEVASADKLPFPDNTFDKIVCNAVLQYCESPMLGRNVIDEFYRVCKPGGKIYVGDLLDRFFQVDFPVADGWQAFTPEELGSGYKYISFKSYYEPNRRFDMIITKT